MKEELLVVLGDAAVGKTTLCSMLDERLQCQPSKQLTTVMDTGDMEDLLGGAEWMLQKYRLKEVSAMENGSLSDVFDYPTLLKRRHQCSSFVTPQFPLRPLRTLPICGSIW